MKKYILMITCLFIHYAAMAQVGINTFVDDVADIYKKMQMSEDSRIRKFMKVAYREDESLHREDLCYYPIYSIYSRKEFAGPFEKNADSLFVYLNPRSLCIRSIFVFAGAEYQGVIERKSKGRRCRYEQELTPSPSLKNLATAVREAGGDLVFTLDDNNYDVFVLKDKTLLIYCLDAKATEGYRILDVDTFFSNYIDDNRVKSYTNWYRPEIGIKVY